VKKTHNPARPSYRAPREGNRSPSNSPVPSDLINFPGARKDRHEETPPKPPKHWMKPRPTMDLRRQTQREIIARLLLMGWTAEKIAAR
jgi:hypothetical protein